MTPNQCSLCGCTLPEQSRGDGGCSWCGYGQWFRTRETGGCIIVDLLAGMNPEEAAVDNLAELLTQRIRAPRLLLNLREIDFVTSTFLNRLLVLRRKIQDARGRLLLCDLNPVIQEIFEVNQLASLFDVFPSEREALGE
jgi:anti-anti-sigma factor